MKLQVGRTYRTRDDRTVEIIDLYEKPGWYRGRTVVTELDTWKENGGYDPEGEESRMDLIEEVSPPLHKEEFVLARDYDSLAEKLRVATEALEEIQDYYERHRKEECIEKIDTIVDEALTKIKGEA